MPAPHQRSRATATRGGSPPRRFSDDKSGLHPRNRHRQRYDFQRLIAASPTLARFVARNRFGDDSIDFADPAAVIALNQALLAHFYGVSRWRIPEGYLCPPIPGRADYVHHLADLLASDAGGVVPRGDAVLVCDIGVGANCVYPIIGRADYGWRFIGSDIDPAAIASARRIVRANPALTGAVDLRLQDSPSRIFPRVLRGDERLDAVMCNPPFHASLADAQQGSRRKWKNLGKAPERGGAEPLRNFGGHAAELWCAGGEAGFVSRMIAESVSIAARCRWFTALIAKESSLRSIARACEQARVRETRIIAMAQGQKRSRIVAWSFLDPRRRGEWQRR